MQKNAKFFGGGGTALVPLPRPLPQWGGDTPSPTPPPRRLWRLDLNPSHSEILPTLLEAWAGILRQLLNT